MKYLIVLNFPVSGNNAARGFQTATHALAYMLRHIEEAESDKKLFGGSLPARTITAHRAQHLETMPETLFWDMSLEGLKALAAAEAQTA